MANTPVNILQNVQLYIKSELAWLDNEYWGIANANKSLEEFNDKPGNLGDVITFDNTPRYISYDGLVITEQPSVQRLQSLICSQAKNISAAYTDEQFIFNVEQYMDRFGIAAAEEIGAGIETDILKNIVSGVIGNNPNSVSNFQQPQINSGPYRFYGDGFTPINSYQQLAQGWANFSAYGASKHMKRGVIPVDLVPAIIGTGLNQFAPDRNNDISKNWELGRYAGMNVDWSVSNLLPIHVSGFVQNAAAPNNVWTVVSTNDPTGVNVTQITATEPTGSTAANAVLAGDLFQFSDGVAGQPNMRFLTFIGHNPTRLPVQFRAIANANTVAGSATIQVQTINNSIGLVSALNQNQNMNNAIAAGMKFTGLPSHLRLFTLKIKSPEQA